MDIFGTCCSLLGCISTVVSEVLDLCKNAKDNREKYERISQRIETTTSQLRTLYVRLLNGDKNFNSNNAYFVDNLQRYLNAVTEIRNTVKKYDKLKKKNFLQIVNANKYSDKIKNLEKRYERALGDLDFTISMEHYKSIENLGNQVQDLHDTVRKESELSELILKTVEDGFKKLTENSKNLDPQSKMIAKEAHKVNKGEFKISLSYDEFQEKDLTDPKPDNISVRGKIFKKMLKETIQVACVPFNAQLYYKDEKDELEATLAILSKLHSSDSIIKFHGTSRVNDKDVLIFDWAHMGNLKYVYEEYNKQNKPIPWKKKLKIAYDICLGLQFLHKCEFYHRDVRCKNILIMGPGIATAKIANFFLSRNFGDISRQFKSGEKKYEMERWTAPEKLKKTSYSVECEVFSFGMLLWELSFQQVPYIKKFENNYEKISEHVLNGEREELYFDYKHSSDIQQCFKEIISTAWKHEPGQRLKLPDILTKLETLYNKYYVSSLIKNGADKTSAFEGDDDDDDDDCNVSCEESSTEAISKNSIPLEQGIIFHKENTLDSRKKAWKCFEYHADVLNSPLAKYWKADYLKHGYDVVEIKFEEAKQLFKEAADDDIGEAQFAYAKLIQKDADNDPSIAEECVEYFEMASMNGISKAMLCLGYIYYNGKYNFEKDKDRAISYYNKAAENGNNDAKKILGKINKLAKSV